VTGSGAEEVGVAEAPATGAGRGVCGCLAAEAVGTVGAAIGAGTADCVAVEGNDEMAMGEVTCGAPARGAVSGADAAVDGAWVGTALEVCADAGDPATTGDGAAEV
jgi:hypothetical protein